MLVHVMRVTTKNVTIEYINKMRAFFIVLKTYLISTHIHHSLRDTPTKVLKFSDISSFFLSQPLN